MILVRAKGGTLAPGRKIRLIATRAVHQGLAQGRARQMLWRRRDPQTQTARKAERGHKAHAAVRRGRNPPLRLPRRPQDGRRLTAVGARVRLPKRARISTPNTMSTANAHHRRIVTMIGSHRNGWI